jgi:ABC-type amino acid transport substrate-binding protein
MTYKKQINFYLTLFIVCIALPPLVVLADQDNHQPRTLQSASELDYPPFAVVKPDGTADGFSVDLLKAVAKTIDYKLNISVGPWNEIKKQLAEGKLDVLPLVAHTKEREKIYDFTVPYLQMHGTIFVRKGDKSISTEKDFMDKGVMVMKGFFLRIYVQSEPLHKVNSDQFF